MYLFVLYNEVALVFVVVLYWGLTADLVSQGRGGGVVIEFVLLLGVATPEGTMVDVLEDCGTSHGLGRESAVPGVVEPGVERDERARSHGLGGVGLDEPDVRI